MAHIETRYKCPGCHRWHSTRREAEDCARTHVYPAQWAVSESGKAVRCSYMGEAWALKEADLSDDNEDRKRQLAGG